MLSHGYLKFFILLIWFTSLSIQATTLVPVDLLHLQRYAENVVYVECINNQVEIDPQSNAVVTYTTFAVRETIKGSHQQTITIKQIGGKLKNNGAALVIPGVPKFTVDEKYVLFISKKSKLGFSSPIGLGQGSFQVFKSSNGDKMVSNGRDFAELMAELEKKNMPPAAKAVVMRMIKNKTAGEAPQTTMRLDDFVSVLKGM